MDPREKLKSILQQKKLLHERITQIDNTDVSENKNQEHELAQLLLRKKILEDQKKKQDQYLRLQKEYVERKKQAERERQLERVRNEKRMLELQTAMKKVVFEGIKEKVKGMNSQQLMMRGYLANTDADAPSKPSQSNFKDAFEGYLLETGPQKAKPKYDLNRLNEQRLQIFEKKEEVVMKQILLRELAASDEPIDIDVLNMSREQLAAQLSRRNIDFEEYMHPVQKEDVLDHYEMIQNQANQRIAEKRKDLSQERAEKDAYERYKRQLREEVNAFPFKSLEVVKRLLFDLIDKICDDYDKRHVNRSAEDQQQIARKLQEEYDELWNRNLVQQLSESIVDTMLEDLRKQMVREAAEEVARLSQYAHQRTEECFRVAVGEGEVADKLKELAAYKLPLNFINEDENHLGKPRNDQYMKKLQNSDNNVYQTEQNTVNLVNDIALLGEEQKYLKNVKTVGKNETESKNEQALYIYDRVLYAVTRHGIKAVHSGRQIHSFSPTIDNAVRVSKVNSNWLLESEQAVNLITPWNREELGSPIGSRISNPCGTLSYSMLYPVLSFLGSPCSALLAFEKGQLLKYNFNRNRITSRQTSISHYIPVIQHAKSGDEPPFPLDNRDFIPIQQEKGKPNDEMHEFREFFEHHADPIVFAQFYRVDKLVTVDKALKCALWEYGWHRGASSFEPVFKFQIRSNYQVYKQDENPRYKDIYPISSSPESPEQVYQKYMLTEAFLKLQLYNNPKKQIAYFRSPSWDQQEGEKAIWKITYKESRKQVSKILESYYNVIQGAVSAEQARLVNDTLYLLCQREHIIRNDLKTLKLYSWSIPEKRLGRVGLEIDMYREQRVSNFLIMPQGLRGVEMQLAVVVNSGRVLLFSLVSGQLLKNINDQLSVAGERDRYYFKTVVAASDQGMLYGVTTNAVIELHLEDINSINDRNRLNKTIDNVKRKFFR